MSAPVTSADFDALEGPLTGLLTASRARTRLSKEFHDAARISGQELVAAREPVDLTAAQVRFAERLRTVAEEFPKAAISYNAALGGVDAPLRGLLMRAANVGLEPDDAAEISEALAVLAHVADIGRDQLDRLDEVAGYPYPPLQERLTAITAAIRLMEDERPVLDEWKRLILLVTPDA